MRRMARLLAASGSPAARAPGGRALCILQRHGQARLADAGKRSRLVWAKPKLGWTRGGLGGFGLQQLSSKLGCVDRLSRWASRWRNRLERAATESRTWSGLQRLVEGCCGYLRRGALHWKRSSDLGKGLRPSSRADDLARWIQGPSEEGAGRRPSTRSILQLLAVADLEAREASFEEDLGVRAFTARRPAGSVFKRGEEVLANRWGH